MFRPRGRAAQRQELCRRRKVRFQPGLTAIVGPNGAGKTTLLEAIGYGLFGYMPHRPQVRFMRHGTTEALVQVEFTSPRDGRVYRVERTMRRARSRATGVLAENATTTVSLYRRRAEPRHRPAGR